MDAILSAVAIYIILLFIFRLAGKRSLSQATPFDLVLLLIIGESTQQALLGDDFSLTNAVTVFVTLVTVDTVFSFVKRRFRRVDQWLEGSPLVLVENGNVLESRLEKERVDVGDVLETARRYHGIERVEQIKYAILEKGGDITVIPKN